MPIIKNQIMTLKDAMDLILKELASAEAKHPYWPEDPIHAAAVVSEEAGELTMACNDLCYREDPDRFLYDAIEEAAQTGAMALRFLINAQRMKPTKSVRFNDTGNGRMEDE